MSKQEESTAREVWLMVALAVARDGLAAPYQLRLDARHYKTVEIDCDEARFEALAWAGWLGAGGPHVREYGAPLHTRVTSWEVGPDVGPGGWRWSVATREPLSVAPDRRGLAEAVTTAITAPTVALDPLDEWSQPDSKIWACPHACGYYIADGPVSDGETSTDGLIHEHLDEHAYDVHALPDGTAFVGTASESRAATEASQRWWFTFGGGHTYPGTGLDLSRAYIVIEGTYDSARALMFASPFENRWSHQYASADDAGVGAFGLLEVFMPRVDDQPVWMATRRKGLAFHAITPAGTRTACDRFIREDPDAAPDRGLVVALSVAVDEIAGDPCFQCYPRGIDRPQSTIAAPEAASPTIPTSPYPAVVVRRPPNDLGRSGEVAKTDIDITSTTVDAVATSTSDDRSDR